MQKQPYILNKKEKEKKEAGVLNGLVKAINSPPQVCLPLMYVCILT
jgi:hypothetical protein